MSEFNTASPVFAGMIGLKRFAQDAGVSERTVQRWVAMGLPCLKRGKLRLLDIDQARAWLRGEPKPGARRRRAA